MHRRRHRAGREEIELLRLLAFFGDGPALARGDLLERAGEACERHAIEIAEVRDETEQRFEFGLVLLVHVRERLSRQVACKRGSAAIEYLFDTCLGI
jgi:hypothetical protein